MVVRLQVFKGEPYAPHGKLSNCPSWWQNFLRTIPDSLTENDDRWMYRDAMLEKWGAEFSQGTVDNYYLHELVFADEQKAVEFLLKWT